LGFPEGERIIISFISPVKRPDPRKRAAGIPIKRIPAASGTLERIRTSDLPLRS